MTTLSTIVLSLKGEVRKVNLQYENLTFETLKKHFKKKENPELICHYEYDENNIFKALISRIK